MSTALNLTVFIGNGFDLSAGMKTGTAEFMDFFANKHESNEGPVGRLAKKILEDGPQNWADFEKTHNINVVRCDYKRTVCNTFKLTTVGDRCGI